MQKRAEVTRAALLQAAAVVFTRVGYAHARLNTITTGAHVSKGALYDHFNSKEELARAVIDAGSVRFTIACSPFLTSPIPAFEALIGISCTLLDPVVNDTTVRATFRLITEVPDRPDAGTPLLTTWLSDYQKLARRAITEGDLHHDDPDAIALLLVETLAGTRVLAAATDHLDDLPVRLTTTWDLLLPGLVAPANIDYFRELLTRHIARVGHRGTTPPPAPGAPPQLNKGETVSTTPPRKGARRPAGNRSSHSPRSTSTSRAVQSKPGRQESS
ncbi:TetR family transcriptional regulator [Rhodococcus jostii]|uniref:TetR family transcriptional regulator n=1 Tax=Rhodococcus jostii TaxID=132919 RepID=UPI00362D07D3